MKRNDKYSSREGTNIRRPQYTLRTCFWAAGIDCFRIADRSESWFLNPKSDPRDARFLILSPLRYYNIGYVIISRDAFFVFISILLRIIHTLRVCKRGQVRDRLLLTSTFHRRAFNFSLFFLRIGLPNAKILNLFTLGHSFCLSSLLFHISLVYFAKKWNLNKNSSPFWNYLTKEAPRYNNQELWFSFWSRSYALHDVTKNPADIRGGSHR